MTGGSLEESRQALAIAETDGLSLSAIYLFYLIVHGEESPPI